jgi:hypothetical protein
LISQVKTQTVVTLKLELNGDEISDLYNIIIRARCDRKQHHLSDLDSENDLMRVVRAAYLEV